ncbi:M20 aminoacylase family protein [Janthinobacterium fluminis]|uniref:M20 family metallopeptidase n=1 Tax=Janthinobacterium fluminis TaxID=2987524 RepID=A0ABT5JZT6_9BURK|nr:M20 aminoacylase family protein [Janthinobacterium fluminis]MDC8757950.1 M20 family metallopeptidase [Janthinobacterium fluminis]
MTDDQIVEVMRSCRRALHARPETAFEEHATARLLAETLRAHGIDVFEGVGRTGLVAVLRNGAGPSIGLRADMDALPVQEANSFGHRSVHDGKMHACGHDGHAAMLLGAALHLNANRDWRGTVHCIFQPAEEALGGGKVMVEEGLFERFPCDAVYGLHNWPGLPAGSFAVNHGPMMAAFDTFEISVDGKGSHAAMPEKGIDSLVIASEIVLALQTIVSRRLAPQVPAVVTVTQIHGGDAWNVIPAQAVLRGTVRCFSEPVQRQIHGLIGEIAGAAAAMHGGRATLTYHYAYPPTINSDAETDLAIAAATQTVGADKVIYDCQPSMASEDFSFMLRVKRGAYIWMGVDGDVPSATLHNPHYDFNDDTLVVGMRYWHNLVLACGAA